VIQATVERIAAHPPVSEAHSALQYSILTDLSKVSPATLKRLGLLIEKYL